MRQVTNNTQCQTKNLWSLDLISIIKPEVCFFAFYGSFLWHFEISIKNLGADHLIPGVVQQIMENGKLFSYLWAKIVGS